MTDNTMATSFEDEAGSNNKKVLLIAGGVAGALVLGGAGYFLLSGGSSDDASFSLPVAKSPKVAAAKAPVRKATAPVTKVPPASSIKIGRDPFSALYVIPAVAPATATTSTSTGTTTSSSGGTGTPAAAPGTTVGERYTIVLTKVTNDPGGAKLFTFKIGTVSKTVLPAQRFGKYGELVVLSYTKSAKGAVTGAVLQVGDDNPIVVPVGVKTSVQ